MLAKPSTVDPTSCRHGRTLALHGADREHRPMLFISPRVPVDRKHSALTRRDGRSALVISVPPFSFDEVRRAAASHLVGRRGQYLARTRRGQFHGASPGGIRPRYRGQVREGTGAVREAEGSVVREAEGSVLGTGAKSAKLVREAEGSVLGTGAKSAKRKNESRANYSPTAGSRRGDVAEVVNQLQKGTRGLEI